jgi:hypothetical protein
MVMNDTSDPPFWAIVGNSDEATWSNSAVAYITFYHQFFKDVPLEICVDLMRRASGDSNFLSLPGHSIKSNWIESGLDVIVQCGWCSLRLERSTPCVISRIVGHVASIDLGNGIARRFLQSSSRSDQASGLGPPWIVPEKRRKKAIRTARCLSEASFGPFRFFLSIAGSGQSSGSPFLW